ncbi:MAG: hypothetical protein JW880_08000 [Candidatus Thermoplasmatota archaeon]|nr:hypothetical protein [Candidatus Thermoplasmatota archaeon]
MNDGDRQDCADGREEPAGATASSSARKPEARGDTERPKQKTKKMRRVRRDSVDHTEQERSLQGAGGSAQVAEPSPPTGKRSYVHFFHFDAGTGKVSYIDDEKSSSEMICECHRCGTLLQFEANRCPVCGVRFDEGDSGIVALLSEKSLDWDDACEMDCPQCGEHVELVQGSCPACGASIASPGDAGADEKPCQLVSSENVVFVHLDVELGQVEYLQRLDRSRGFEHMAVQLKDIGSDESMEG